MSLKGGCIGLSDSTFIKYHNVGNHMWGLNYHLIGIKQFKLYFNIHVSAVIEIQEFEFWRLLHSKNTFFYYLMYGYV